MTAARTVQHVKDGRERYGPVISLENVGINMNSSALFEEHAQTTSYQAQVLQHAAMLDINDFTYVVGSWGIF